MRARAIAVVVVAFASAICFAVESAAAGIRAGRLGIGDSVMLGAKHELHAHGFRIVDAVESRQFSSARSRIRYWKNAGKLPKNVVIHLGNNGYIQMPDCLATVKAAGARRVFLVNLKVPRPWRAPNNRLLHRCAKRFQKAHLIDWYRHSHGHSSWFARDGYHLTGTGASAYASFVSHRIASLS